MSEAEQFRSGRAQAINSALQRVGFTAERASEIGPVIDRVETLEWTSRYPIQPPFHDDVALLDALRAADVLGDEIGRGPSRDIYELKGCPELVAKVHVRPHSLSNASEWLIWQWVNSSELGRWLAPCVWIDHSSRILIQRRTRPMAIETWKALMVPDVLLTRGPADWGLIDGRPVSHDACGFCIDRARLIGAEQVRLRPALDDRERMPTNTWAAELGI